LLCYFLDVPEFPLHRRHNALLFWAHSLPPATPDITEIRFRTLHYRQAVLDDLHFAVAIEK
jgi:hypothetical protein